MDGVQPTQVKRCVDAFGVCEHLFVAELRYSVIEYDPRRPWVMVSRTRGLVVDIDAEDFPAWAARAWPPPRYAAELEPGPLRPWPEP